MANVITNDALRKKKRMHTPRLKVWKLRESNVRKEFARVVAERKNDRLETDNVESKWNAMKEVWQKATEQVSGWTKGPQRHSETWWWNEEVARAIEEKRCYKIWHNTKTASDLNKEARQDAWRRRSALLHRERQGKSLLMSWRVQQERRMSIGLQSKWQNPGRM